MSQLKQRYLLANSPSPPNFIAERTQQFQRILVLITTTERTKWLSTGFSLGPMIESYKQVYGLTSQQFESLLTVLVNIAFCEEDMTTDVRAAIFRLLNTIGQYQIKITDNFSLSNKKLVKYLWELAEQGLQGNLKHSDNVIEDLSKFILFFSRFGQDVIEEALKMAIRCNDMRYLAIFIRSMKTQASAKRLLTELFADNNLWDRDNSWFYILGQIVKKFPKLDYSEYYSTVMHEVIRSFTAIINGDSDDILKKLTSTDGYLQIPSSLKSIALILVFLMLPEEQPQHIFVKSCIERLFSLIVGSLDYINQQQFLGQWMTFLKTFTRFYLLRFRTERGLFKLKNEDEVEDFHQPVTQDLMIDDSMQLFFDSLWNQIIPKLLFFDDPEECRPSKIITELCIYKPEVFLELSLNSILNLVSRDDPTLVSFHCSKITILFLQEFIITEQPSYLSILLQCIQKMMNHMQTLGIPDNLDLIQLFFRCFLSFTNEQINLHPVQTMIDDVLAFILNNLEPISIGLQIQEEDQAELYLDLSNMFMQFFVRLDDNQIKMFQERFLFKLANQVPQNQTAYEQLTIALAYIDQSFSHKVFKILYEKMVTHEKTNKIEEEKQIQWQFLPKTQGKLHIENQKILKWYGALIQCIFQYHPSNVVKNWSKIETIMILLLKEWEKPTCLQIGLDIIFNVLLCLLKHHFSYKEFTKPENFRYQTLNIEYKKMTEDEKSLIDYIYQTYFINIKKFLQDVYGKQLQAKGSDGKILSDFETYYQQSQNNDIIRIRKRNLKLVDYVLMPKVIQTDQLYDQKIIYRAMSMQYTIVSALMYRAPLHEKIQNIGDFLVDQKYRSLRKDTCKYLEWVMHLLGHFGMFSDELSMKVFNFFWRESHDQVCYSASIQATDEKITPYYYSQIHRKKSLLRGPFLIINEAYMTHMARVEYSLITQPTAHLNNHRYLQSNFILGLSTLYEPGLHSFFPGFVEVHQYHRQLISIVRYHLNSTNPDGFLFKYIKQQDQAMKQRYATAVRSMVVGLKRLLNIFSDKCCMRDEFIRNTIFEVIGLYRILPNKKEKTLIFELIYVMLVFSFQNTSIQELQEYSLRKYWELKLNQSQQASKMQFATIKNGINYQNLLQEVDKQESLVLTQMDFFRSLKLTRSCSFENDSEMQKQLDRAISYLISKMEETMTSKQKDSSIYLLMLLLYSNNLDLKNPLIGKLIILLSKLTQLDQFSDLFEMSKTGFFRMVNRFNYHKRIRSTIPNTPVKRSWEDFLRMKYIGGDESQYQKLKIDKSQETFYPSSQLTIHDYKALASDPSSETYQNEKILLEVLEDGNGMFKFMKNCSLDPELKQTESTQATFVLSEDNLKSVSTGAHKLMHFIWDGNPVRTPLFMGILERYSMSPLNFYNRIFRKIIRQGTEKTKEVCYEVAERLRKCQEMQMIKLSANINCQLLAINPHNPLNEPFLDYITECTKQHFEYVLTSFYGIFTSNFIIAQRSYQIVLKRLRNLKGAARLRHLDVSNHYIIAQGRFSRKAAIEMYEMIMRGISQGGDQISDAIVSIITECMVQAINIKTISEWVDQPQEQLVQKSKLYILNNHVGYNRQHLLVDLLHEMLDKSKKEDESPREAKLKMYSQMVRKILASINIFRFNQYFYKLLKQVLFYVVNRHQATDKDDSDLAMTFQLSDSEYPEDIYQHLLEQLLPMSESTPYVVKKKLIFIQGIVINRSFRLNKFDVPPLLQLNEKKITLDYIITLSNIFRIMKSNEITEEVQRILNSKDKSKHQTYFLVALLMATGVREYEWKETVLKNLVKHKKDKLVKDAIAQWWKGKNPDTPQESRLAELTRNFQNPYSYFA